VVMREDSMGKVIATEKVDEIRYTRTGEKLK